MTEKNMEILRTWEVTYRPFPALIAQRGFDTILNALADVAFAEPGDEDAHPALRSWGNVLLGSHEDRQINISIDAETGPPNPKLDASSEWSGYIQGLGYTIEYTKEHFQQALAAVLADLGLEGDLHVEEVVTVIEINSSEDEDADDDATD